MSDTYHGHDDPVPLRGFEGSDILRLALLSLAAIIALALAINLFMDAGRQSEPHIAQLPPAAGAPEAASAAQNTSLSSSDGPVREARESVEREIADKAPEYAVFFDRLHGALPAEYDTIVDGFARQALDGKDLSLDALLSQAVRDLRVSNGILAAKADGPALSHIFDIQLRMMQALAGTDPKLCVDFLYGGASQAFFAFSAAHRPLVADMAIAGLEAINSGRANQIDRDAPTDTDFNQLSSAMKSQGVTDAEVAAILDGKTPNPPIPDARMCTVGQIYLKTLAALPEQARLRIYALAVSLMARS